MFMFRASGRGWVGAKATSLKVQEVLPLPLAEVFGDLRDNKTLLLGAEGDEGEREGGAVFDDGGKGEREEAMRDAEKVGEEWSGCGLLWGDVDERVSSPHVDT